MASWVSSKLKTSKDAGKRIKRQATHWDKILANHMSVYNIQRLYRELRTQGNKWIKKQAKEKKQTKGLNRQFTKVDTQMTNKHMKRCSVA